MMNRQQLDYARERAKALYAEVQEALNQRYRTEAVTLNTPQTLSALRAGRFTIKRKSHHYHWYNAVDFTDELEASFDQAGYNKALKPFKRAYEKLTDTLVLGNVSEAAVLIEGFAKLVSRVVKEDA